VSRQSAKPLLPAETSRGRLIWAADQYLIIAHRAPGSSREAAAVPAMHESEAAFRWISAVEGLLAADDSDRSDLTRKTAQRAAVLIGQDDDEPLAMRDLMRTADAARSAYAHGGSPMSVDLAAPADHHPRDHRGLDRAVGRIPGRPVSDVRDDALLSARTSMRPSRCP